LRLNRANAVSGESQNSLEPTRARHRRKRHCRSTVRRMPVSSCSTRYSEVGGAVEYDLHGLIAMSNEHPKSSSSLPISVVNEKGRCFNDPSVLFFGTTRSDDYFQRQSAVRTKLWGPRSNRSRRNSVRWRRPFKTAARAVGHGIGDSVLYRSLQKQVWRFIGFHILELRSGQCASGRRLTRRELFDTSRWCLRASLTSC